MEQNHKIEFRLGPDGFYTKLICPENCDEKEVHEDQYQDLGLELLPCIAEEVLLTSVDAQLKWTGQDEEAELWIYPIVAED